MISIYRNVKVAYLIGLIINVVAGLFAAALLTYGGFDENDLLIFMWPIIFALITTKPMFDGWRGKFSSTPKSSF